MVAALILTSWFCQKLAILDLSTALSLPSSVQKQLFSFVVSAKNICQSDLSYISQNKASLKFRIKEHLLIQKSTNVPLIRHEPRTFDFAVNALYTWFNWSRFSRCFYICKIYIIIWNCDFSAAPLSDCWKTLLLPNFYKLFSYLTSLTSLWL